LVHPRGSSEDETTKTPEGIWTLEFDGAHSSSGSGVGIVLTTPSKETFYYSYRLEYHCTNNIVEYEALILGLNLAIDKGVTHLRVIGDSDLIVSQVLLDFATKNERLKRYRDFARSIAKSFEIVSIKAVPREENYVADALAVSLPPYNLVMVHSKTCAKWKSCLDLRSLITWNIGKSLKMMTKSLDSWKIVENSPIHK
jgi:ribonuclease HI